jgi:ankyrin repeat protein
VHLAAQAGHAACVEVLGKYFANVNIVNEFNGRCAVHDAALNGNCTTAPYIQLYLNTA